ncbi:EAL domain-containing response regulator [Pseudomonas sp. TH05]|uniref:EAL domain-containing response regulator n=1 Tax=unclassified Pseudomonas TaxID=196821 RepID=UPI000996BEE9|nr:MULTISPECIES: EAL domain-containing response regulator [unclassified Pseudomonas]MBK5541203.1 EAL domain-containing response regulator [Pseudomonas sp. TH07]MBK5558052.1 EAL domain-containing response regulator [Pseudomonas sp. TH05]OOV90605.1 diguanylate phosphodiesterase [Pseudomonas sp. MF4836]
MQDLIVLVLEDEPFQRLVTVTALEKLLPGRVLQAADGDKAVAILAECSHVDIVLCDLKMAGMDGLAFLRHASNSGKVRGVVLCSELEPILRQATVSMIHCLGLPFLGDLGKPFNMEGFCLLVKRYQARCNAAPILLSPAEMPTLGDVRQGLDDHQFEAYYQPKVTLHGQVLVGAEVLARWAHPQLGILAPAHFLPVMEQHNLIDRMFWHLFEQGLALHQRLAAQGRGINLAFNLHPAQLANAVLTERIPMLLKRAKVPPASVMFEITESALIGAPASSLENLVRLRILGCGLAMDDFGAGYSSLDRLSELPFSQIKLDRAFVHKMQSQPRSAAIVSCSVALARALNISLVIEGVETVEQQARLIELGCSIGQGFLFARPMPENHFIDYCLGRAANQNGPGNDD